MRIHRINRSTSLEFHSLRGRDFIPKIVQDSDIISIPLLVAEGEIDRVTDKLGLIDFMNLPLHYIEMIVAGCISTVLKYCHNN